VEFEIAGVRPCSCASHARVVLKESVTGRKLQVRVHADAGQDLLSELAGVASGRGRTADILRDTLAAIACSLEGVTLRCREGKLCAVLGVHGPNGSRNIDAEPCEALVVACRMKLPVFVEEQANDEAMPEAFKEFVASLDFSGLGDAEHGRD
jgi:bifunctional DNase/RNase